MTMNPRATSDFVTHNIRQDVQDMHAYAVQDASGLIKLDAMENPHRLPPELQAALGERLGAVALNRYPTAASMTCAVPWPPMRACQKALTSCWAMARMS